MLFLFAGSATTEIYTLSLHDALPISLIYVSPAIGGFVGDKILGTRRTMLTGASVLARSEEHTSELQSHVNLVCRLLLEKKNIIHDLRHKHRETYKGAEMLFKEL